MLQLLKCSVSHHQACKESCLAFNQRRFCGCMEYRFPLPSGILCDTMNKTQGTYIVRGKGEGGRGGGGGVTDCPLISEKSSLGFLVFCIRYSGRLILMYRQVERRYFRLVRVNVHHTVSRPLLFNSTMSGQSATRLQGEQTQLLL